MKTNHRVILRFTVLAATALVACAGAQAANTCSLSSNGFSSAYVPTNPGTNITPASFTMTCTPNVAGPTSQTYTVSINNGLNNNNAASGANKISYDLYTDSTCVTLWKNKTLGGTINLGAQGVPVSQTVPFWGCIPAGQILVPAGTFTDTVTMNPSIGNTTQFPVSIVTPSSCKITTSPGNINFNYVGFQTTPASTSSNFAATCTNNLPYSLALDATSGILSGLTYTLSLSAPSGVGNGLSQLYKVDGLMAPGQSGDCATGVCSGRQARTLTITY